MKIQKALEKVRGERTSQEIRLKAAEVMSSLGTDWRAPSYTQSKQVAVDRNALDQNRCVCIDPESPYLNAYKILRTQILKYLRERGGNTVMVTSALPGEGKTVVSINLALAFARSFDITVLLMDCDLHKQDIHTYMGIESSRGIVDHLVYGVPLSEVIMWPGIDKFTLVSGGRLVNDTAELLASPKMNLLVEEVRSRYRDRCVIFDVPPVLAGADAIVFASLVDAVIMVIEANKTPMEDVRKALELIPKDKFAGFVLNKDSDRGHSNTTVYYERAR